MNPSSYKLQLLALFTVCILTLQAQKMELPDSLFTNLVKTEFQINDTLSQEFYIEYPKGYKSNIKHPVFIGLAGGNQSLGIVKYCYAAYFNSSLLDEYIKIFPIAYNKKGMMSSGKEYYISLLQTLEKNVSCKTTDWLVAGTSNGGVTALELVTVKPAQFSGLITMPGMIHGDQISVDDKWSHLKALLVVGENDSEGWKKGIHKTDSVLKQNSVQVDVLILPNQGHIIDLDYDIDSIYSKYFKLEE